MFIYLNRLLSESLDTGDALHVVLCVLVAKQLLYPASQLLTDCGKDTGVTASKQREKLNLQGLNMSHRVL